VLATQKEPFFALPEYEKEPLSGLRQKNKRLF
jgi:hypothetical protein